MDMAQSRQASIQKITILKTLLTGEEREVHAFIPGQTLIGIPAFI